MPLEPRPAGRRQTTIHLDDHVKAIIREEQRRRAGKGARYQDITISALVMEAVRKAYPTAGKVVAQIEAQGL